MISTIDLKFQNQNLNKCFDKYYIILLKGKIGMNMTSESHCILCIVSIYILLCKILFLYVHIHVIKS